MLVSGAQYWVKYIGTGCKPRHVPPVNNVEPESETRRGHGWPFVGDELVYTKTQQVFKGVVESVQHILKQVYTRHTCTYTFSLSLARTHILMHV